MEERSGLEPELVQRRTQVAEGSNLKLQQENREGGENSKALAGVDSPPSIAMHGELQGGSRDYGASPFHMDYLEIPPIASPPPQAPVQGPDRAALGISKAAEMSNLNPSTLAASNSNLKVMPPPSKLNLKAMPPPSHPNLKAISPPSDRNLKAMPPPINPNLKAMRPPSDPNLKAMPPPSNRSLKAMPPPINPNLKAMRPPSDPNLKGMRPPSDLNMKLMPPPSYTRKLNVCLPDSQDTAFHSAQTTHPPRSSSFSDKLEDDHLSRESSLQLVVTPEPEERFPMEIVEAKGPFHLSAGLKEPPSNQSAKGNQKEPSFANDGFSVESLRDSIRGHRSSPLEENKKGSGGGTGSDGGRPSNALPCPSCKSTNTRFCFPGRYYCDNCREYWTLSHLQQHEVQLPSKQSSKGKEKEKEKETPYEEADQFSGKGLGDSSPGPRSLPWSGSEDGDGGSNKGPLNALSCSRCRSTFTRLCTYGIFCDACGKHTPFASTRDHEVPADPPVAMVHEVFDVDGRSRGSQMQLLPPPRRPIMVDASTQTDPVVMVPVDRRFGKHIVHGLLHTNTHQVDERKRRRDN